MKRVLFILSLAVIAGCVSEHRGVVPPCPESAGVSGHLLSLGNWFFIVGGLGLFAGVAARILGATGPISKTIISLALVALGFGVCFTWIGEHPWVLAVAIICTGLALMVHYRVDVRRWLRISETSKQKVEQIVSNPSEKAP